MATLSKQKAEQNVKLILTGDSGAGKTGALMALLDAGYKLRIIDTDNGLSILRQNVKPNWDIQFHTIEDEILLRGRELQYRSAKAWGKILSMLSKWEEPDGSTSNPLDWDASYVLVIDTLTSTSEAAMRYIRSTDGRLNGATYLSDYKDAGDAILELIGLLTLDRNKFNLIVMSHIYVLEEKQNENGKTAPNILGMYPNTLGRKLPAKIPQDFDSWIQVKLKGSRRIIATEANKYISLKAGTLKAKPEYPIETGLAEYFRLFQTPPEQWVKTLLFNKER